MSGLPYSNTKQSQIASESMNTVEEMWELTPFPGLGIPHEVKWLGKTYAALERSVEHRVKFLGFILLDLGFSRILDL
jgi:hypothetical protein